MFQGSLDKLIASGLRFQRRQDFGDFPIVDQVVGTKVNAPVEPVKLVNVPWAGLATTDADAPARQRGTLR